MNDPEAHERIHPAVASFFLESGDFNGIPFEALAQKLRLSADELDQALKSALASGEVELSFASKTGNPHIKRLPSEPVEVQIGLLGTVDTRGICVYPNPSTMSIVIGQEYDDRPYTKRLALVEAQLIPCFFELAIFERYFRDPRFECWFGDSNGNVTIGDNAYLSDETQEKDKVSFRIRPEENAGCGCLSLRTRCPFARASAGF